MGIHDRDYIRDAPSNGGMAGSGRGFSWRGLSFTNWLILINIAVFVLDALLLSSGKGVWVPMGDWVDPGRVSDPASLVYPGNPQQGFTRPTSATLPIFDSSTGQQVGERRLNWMAPLQAYGFFSTATAFTRLEIWRFLTFQFLHADFSHILLNMIGLWFFGPLVEEKLGSRKRFAAFYLACGICGAFLYLMLNLIGFLTQASIPLLLHESPYVPLIGASAGVFAVLMASAYYAGAETMYLFMIIPMKVRTGAYLLALIALLNLFRGGPNAGGDAAHVGGAIAGFFFIRNMHLLNDFFDIFGSPRRRSAASSGRKGSRPPDAARRDKLSPREERRLDGILEKVRDKGMESLTARERRFLSRATEGKRQG